MHPKQQTSIEINFRDVQQALANGIVEATAEELRRFWAAWTLWLAFSFPTIDPYCLSQTTAEKIKLLAAFGTHVRQGRFLDHNAKFVPKLSKWRFEPSPRSSNWMDNKTRWSTRKEFIHKRLNSFLADSESLTHHRIAN